MLGFTLNQHWNRLCNQTSNMESPPISIAVPSTPSNTRMQTTTRLPPSQHKPPCEATASPPDETVAVGDNVVQISAVGWDKSLVQMGGRCRP